MQQLIYDGSFEGLLTTVFEIYERKYCFVNIVSLNKTEAMVFSDNITVISDAKKADRVWRGLKNKLSAESLKKIYWAYLSEIKGIENTIFEFIKYVFSSKINIETDYGNASVIEITKTTKKVGREKHRFEAFIRFELMGPDLFYAPMEPDFNVLPIILPHFKKRYADQNWIIYDTKRKFGMYYDKHSEKINEVIIDFDKGAHTQNSGLSFDPEENKYRDLWRSYFKSTNIPIRKNMKLHLQHVPKRYWKYLIEKY